MEQNTSNNSSWFIMMSAVKQYYQLGFSQEQIARNLFISKSTVSRLIKKAVDLGYVEIKVKSFGEFDELLQETLEKKYNIKCYVLPTLVNQSNVRLNDVCAFAAQKVFSAIEDNENIILPCGKTAEYLAAKLNIPYKKDGVKLCMMNGFVSGSTDSLKAIHIIEKLSDMLGAEGYIMPCPLIMGNKETKDIIMEDPSIKKVNSLIRESSTIVFSVGPFDMRNTYLSELGEDVIKELMSLQNAAGNLAGRTYDINGREFQTNYSSRLTGLPLRDLKTKQKRICVAVGNYKAKAILGLLRGGFITELYTESETAREILREEAKLS